MDYEEKYNLALERARSLSCSSEYEGYKKIFESIFPELAESEDEKTRKELISLVKSHCFVKNQKGEATKKKMLAWLEKQGEHKDTYTKQQLRDMGFAFTLNGDIVTPEKTNEAIKEYLANEKKKWEKEQKLGK